jgi:hypothetical protein
MKHSRKVRKHEALKKRKKIWFMVFLFKIKSAFLSICLVQPNPTDFDFDNSIPWNYRVNTGLAGKSTKEGGKSTKKGQEKIKQMITWILKYPLARVNQGKVLQRWILHWIHLFSHLKCKVKPFNTLWPFFDLSSMTVYTSDSQARTQREKNKWYFNFEVSACQRTKGKCYSVESFI